MDAQIVALSPAKPAHDRVVSFLVAESCLTYPIAENGLDDRCARWLASEGQWAVAIVGDDVAGIAMTLPKPDGGAWLTWLEVRPQHQGRGVGTSLLAWARATAGGELTIASVPEAASLYTHRLPFARKVGGVYIA